MKVLFVSSGNKKDGISPIVYNQGESLKANDVELEYYTVNLKGWKGYLRHLVPLAKVIKNGGYDVVHAHYSLCGFLATFAAPLRTAIVVSLMGTFRKNTVKYYLIRLLAACRWKAVIVKSERMKMQIGLSKAPIIPNGVQIEKFTFPHTQPQLRAELGLALQQRIVIFVSDPARPEKNFKLCKESVETLQDDRVMLIPVFNKPHDDVAKYMLAADVLMLTSFTEGSPNVIKEAMAAGCPIVTTDVGDVHYLLKDLEGTYIMQDFTPEEGARMLRKALAFGQKTAGLARLKTLRLTLNEVADQLKKVYL